MVPNQGWLGEQKADQAYGPLIECVAKPLGSFHKC